MKSPDLLMYSSAPAIQYNRKSNVQLGQSLERLSLGYFQSLVEESVVGSAKMRFYLGTELEFLLPSL